MNTRLFAIPIASLILASAPCAASVVLFDNSAGVFHWQAVANGCQGCAPGEFLSLTHAADAQSGLPASDQHIYYEFDSRSVSKDPVVQYVHALPTASLAIGPVQVFYDSRVSFRSNLPILAMSEGWIVGPNLRFAVRGVTEYSYPLYDLDIIDLPDHYYVGVRFAIGAETHYGWVELLRTSNQPRPVRWAYEDAPDTSIVIPGAGSPPPPPSVIVFPNPGFEFMWAPRNEQSPASSPGQWLNVPFASDAQPDPGPTWALRYSHDAQTNPFQPKTDSLQSESLDIAVNPPQTFSSSSGPGSITIRPPAPLSEGQTVGPALTYLSHADMFLRWSTEHIFLHLAPDHFYVGVRFTLFDGVHYGWIELVPRIDAVQPWLPIRWAYHPLPDVPVVLPAFSPPQPLPPFCPDLNADHMINGTDLAILLGSWGTFGAADLDGDGLTNSRDLALLLASWGPCP